MNIVGSQSTADWVKDLAVTNEALQADSSTVLPCVYGDGAAGRADSLVVLQQGTFAGVGPPGSQEAEQHHSRRLLQGSAWSLALHASTDALADAEKMCRSLTAQGQAQLPPQWAEPGVMLRVQLGLM